MGAGGRGKGGRGKGPAGPKAAPIARPSWDYEAKIKSRPYGDQDEKERRELERQRLAEERMRARAEERPVELGKDNEAWVRAATGQPSSTSSSCRKGRTGSIGYGNSSYSGSGGGSSSTPWGAYVGVSMRGSADMKTSSWNDSGWSSSASFPRADDAWSRYSAGQGATSGNWGSRPVASDAERAARAAERAREAQQRRQAAAAHGFGGVAKPKPPPPVMPQDEPVVVQLGPIAQPPRPWVKREIDVRADGLSEEVIRQARHPGQLAGATVRLSADTTTPGALWSLLEAAFLTHPVPPPILILSGRFEILERPVLEAEKRGLRVQRRQHVDDDFAAAPGDADIVLVVDTL
mmetsp:Transcript_15927/g.46040  ORF Transcript_15927/g.46040 Transcript_15927/m.46040 type:complete len:349 (+) Transcript_15927:66-1112(+)